MFPARLFDFAGERGRERAGGKIAICATRSGGPPTFLTEIKNICYFSASPCCGVTMPSVSRSAFVLVAALITRIFSARALELWGESS